MFVTVRLALNHRAFDALIVAAVVMPAAQCSVR